MPAAWTSFAYVLTAAGFALALWSLFWDRARGRLRCPKCWYDMADVPSSADAADKQVCPECGKHITSVHALRRTRRRWGWTATAGLALIAAYFSAVMPRVQSEGVRGLIPTTALILSMRWMDPIDPACRVWSPKLVGQSQSLASNLWNLAKERTEQGEPANWQKQLMLSWFTAPIGRRDYGSIEWAAVEGELLYELRPRDGDLWQRVRSIGGLRLESRPQWPRGVPVYGVVYPWTLARAGLGSFEKWAAQPSIASFRQFTGSSTVELGCGGSSRNTDLWSDGLISLGTSESCGRLTYSGSIEWMGRDSSDYEVVFAGRSFTGTEIIDASGLEHPALALMTPVASREVEKQIEAGEVFRFVNVGGDTYRLCFDSSSIQAELARLNVTFAVTVELLWNGEPFGAVKAWWRVLPFQTGAFIWPTHGGLDIPTVPSSVLDLNNAWTVRVRADPETALRDLESDQFWQGNVQAPVHLPK